MRKLISLNSLAASAFVISLVAAASTISAEPRSYLAGDEIQDCDACPVMVVLPIGNLLMGSSTSNQTWRDTERPQRSVVIDQSIAVSKYEVSFAQWDECVSDGGCNGYRPEDNGWGRSQRPVINISWDNAKAYVTWLSQRTGQPYRLLSEAEWEYAARAGTTTEFHWGDRASREYSNFGVEGCCGGHAEGQDRWVNTAPVGSFPPNKFGLHDMHGNVWEWVEDCRVESYEGATSSAQPITKGDCDKRIMRGGSWFFKSSLMRSAFRGWGWTSDRGDTIGLRVAISLDNGAGT